MKRLLPLVAATIFGLPPLANADPDCSHSENFSESESYAQLVKAGLIPADIDTETEAFAKRIAITPIGSKATKTTMGRQLYLQHHQIEVRLDDGSTITAISAKLVSDSSCHEEFVELYVALP